MRIGKQIRLRDKQRGYLSAAMKVILFGGRARRNVRVTATADTRTTATGDTRVIA